MLKLSILIFLFFIPQHMRRQVGAVRGHAWIKREFPRESVGRGVRKVSKPTSPSPWQHTTRRDDSYQVLGELGTGELDPKKKSYPCWLKTQKKIETNAEIFLQFFYQIFVYFFATEKLETEPPFNVLSIFVDFENLMMFCLVWCHWK